MIITELKAIQDSIKKIIATLLFFIFEPLCGGCKTYVNPEMVLCNSCAQKIKPLVSVDHMITQTHSITVYAAGAYQDPLQQMILAKQYRDIGSCTLLAEIIYQYTPIKNMDFDIIVPIPLHWSRFAFRGYNQAEEMAHVLSKKLGIPVVHLLTRNKKTKFQLNLTAEDRTYNVKSAFKITHSHYIEKYKKCKILVVDDLMTTGSTIIEASKTLLSLKPTELKAVVAART